MVVFGTNRFSSKKVDVFGQRWLYSGKSGFIRLRMVVFGQKLFYSGKYFFLGQKLLYSGKSGSIRAEAVVFGQIGCIWAKVVVFG